MGSELKPCPFCGNYPVVRMTPEFRGFAEPDGFALCCENRSCPIRPKTIWYRTKEESYSAWNRRSGLPPASDGGKLEKEERE